MTRNIKHFASIGALLDPFAPDSVIPTETVKGRRADVVIPNDAALSMVQAQRGKHPIWVFPIAGDRSERLNNTTWQTARRKVGVRAAHQERWATAANGVP